VSESTRRREAGRGERVVPGVWRLRLPLPWPGVPHGNAWAIAAGDGIVLVDSGMHEPGSLAHLERALDQVNLRLEHVRLLICTHAHSDHYGQAATVLDRAGCELWMHPNHEHATRGIDDPDRAIERRLEVARQSGVPEAPLREWAERRRSAPPGFVRVVLPDRPLLDGVEVETDLGTWRAIETPGHAPSHVCLHQPEERLLLTGDLLARRFAPFFDYGWSADPVAEYLASLDAVAGLDVELVLPGHGAPLRDLGALVASHRAGVHDRLAAVRGALAAGAAGGYELTRRIFGRPPDVIVGVWQLAEVVAYLGHLRRAGEVVRFEGADGAYAYAVA
jgi:glyoxylase-like metal-dependent hydrolase (beta-lactamase superfamily II)